MKQTDVNGGEESVEVGRGELIIATLFQSSLLKAFKKDNKPKTFSYLKLESLEITFGPSGISRLLCRISFS